MKSAIRPIRSMKWINSFSLLVASVSFHGLVLLAMLLVIKAQPFGNEAFGLADGETFSVTWIPTAGSGSERHFDAFVSDMDSGRLLELSSQSVAQSVGANSRLLVIAHTDPQMVFNRESSDSLAIMPEAAVFPPGTTQPKLTRTSSDRQDADDGVGKISNSTAVMKSTSQPDPKATFASGHESADSNGDGIAGGDTVENPGHGGNPNAGQGRTAFFGISTRAKRIVYVIDASESMRQHNAMELARRQLQNSLKELAPTSQFQVVFFNLTNHTMNRQGERPRLLPATSSNLRWARQFISGIQPDSGTDRLSAIVQALNFEPDVIFLLTDADAPELSANDLWNIHRRNKRKSVIHVVEFGVGGDLGEDSFLKRLTRQSSGTHRYHDLTCVEQ